MWYDRVGIKVIIESLMRKNLYVIDWILGSYLGMSKVNLIVLLFERLRWM